MIITEKTTENMSVLRECLDVIIKALPRTFPTNQRTFIRGSELDGFYRLVKKYEGTAFETSFRSIVTRTIFDFDNTERFAGTGQAGAFVMFPGESILSVRISSLMGSSDEHSREDVLAKRLPDQAIQSFRAILLHELRHLFQSNLYSKFYNSSSGDYKTMPIELDAAWSHHLEDHSPTGYPSVSAYVDAVMKSFASYKNLTPEQERHYRRKTARYYFDETKKPTDDDMRLPLRDRLEKRRKPFRDWLIKVLNTPTDKHDMRNLPGYDRDARNFFFPDRVLAGVRSIIVKDTKTTVRNAAFVYLSIALSAPPGTGPSIAKYLKTTLRLSLQDALDNVDVFPDGFDHSAIRHYIMTFYT